MKSIALSVFVSLWLPPIIIYMFLHSYYSPEERRRWRNPTTLHFLEEISCFAKSLLGRAYCCCCCWFVRHSKWRWFFVDPSSSDWRGACIVLETHSSTVTLLFRVLPVSSAHELQWRCFVVRRGKVLWGLAHSLGDNLSLSEGHCGLEMWFVGVLRRVCVCGSVLIVNHSPSADTEPFDGWTDDTLTRFSNLISWPLHQLISTANLFSSKANALCDEIETVIDRQTVGQVAKQAVWFGYYVNEKRFYSDLQEIISSSVVYYISRDPCCAVTFRAVFLQIPIPNWLRLSKCDLWRWLIGHRIIVGMCLLVLSWTMRARKEKWIAQVKSPLVEDCD